MHSLTHFHEQQRNRDCGTYGDVGDKEYDYVVTKDGEVYYRRAGMFGAGALWDSYYYQMRYSGVTKTESSWFGGTVYEGGDAKQIASKVIASWNDYNTAKQYADRVVANARKGALTPPPSPLAPGGGEGGGGGLGDGSGAKTALIAVGVLVALGGLGWAASKLKPPPSEVT